jgi:D-alanyl-D-alanine carboxypeptidase
MKGISGPAEIHAKTGSLEHVRAMSGYARTYGGENVIFSIFANNNREHGTDATETLDAIGMAMVQTLRPPKKRERRAEGRK